MMVIRRLANVVNRDLIQKRLDLIFLKQVLWTVIKAKINLRIEIKRWGPSYEERSRREVRRALCSLGSCVHLREITAAKTIIYVLRYMKSCE